MHHAAQILANDVEFNVYNTTYLESVEVRVFVCIRNDSHLETVVSRITYSKAYTIYSY